MTAPSANNGSTLTPLLRAASQWVIGVAPAAMLTLVGFTVMLLTPVFIWVNSRQVASSVDTPPA